MNPEVTLVRSPLAHPLERLALLAIALFAALLLALSLRVTPDPRGLGTHEGLGLPPCALYRATGIPCPSCGMTTAFAHAVRGDLAASARAQPLGFLLALGAVAAVLVAPALALRGATIAARFTPRAVQRALLFFFALAALAWIYKIVAVKCA